MNIWVICIGETLPIDGGNQRRMRAGMLTQALSSMGHQVTWWTSAFNHSSKRHRSEESRKDNLTHGAQLWLLHGIGYNRNIGIRRLLNHYQLAREFKRLAPKEPAPDLIFCCWPSIELGLAAVDYAGERDIPILMDVRDLWPDIFRGAVPSWCRFLLKPLLAPYDSMTHSAFRRASGIIGISEGYLAWGLGKAGRERNDNDALFPIGYQEPDWTSMSVIKGMNSLGDMGIDESRTVCWFLGSFADTYDLEPVIEAARRLEPLGHESPQFVLSGDGLDGERYRKLSAGLSNVVFTGWLNADRIASMMKIASVAIAAYKAGAPQGLPNKIFEYMAAGLPILSSLEGECKSFLAAHDCGLSYQPGSVEGFLEALGNVTRDESAARHFGANGLRAYRQFYSSTIIYPSIVRHIAARVSSRLHVHFPV